MLAVSTMDPTVQGVLFLVAVLLFVLGAAHTLRAGLNAVGLVALGLAVATFVAMWNAFAAG